jgi:hypothetical protein
MTALHTWHSLNQLHLEFFSNSLEGVPTYAEHLLAAFPSLCGPTHPKPSQLGWGRVIVEVKSSDASLLGQIALRWPNLMTQHSVTSKAPPPCLRVWTTHAEIIHSPTLHLTKTRQLEPKISNLDSSDQGQISTSLMSIACVLGPSKSLLIGVL